MPGRAVSPTGSEFEYDISAALGAADSDDDGPAYNPRTLHADRSIGEILGGGEDDDDDDEAFIAAQQAASNRKASNLKGKNTVKKGGGFQQMGMLFLGARMRLVERR